MPQQDRQPKASVHRAASAASGRGNGAQNLPSLHLSIEELGIKALHLDLCSSGTARGADSHHQGPPPTSTVPGALSEPPAEQDHLKHLLKSEKYQEITQIQAPGVEQRSC